MKISNSKLLVLYCALFPIIPTYLTIPGIASVTNILGAVLLMVIMLTNQKVMRIPNRTTELSLLIFAICTILISFAHGAVISGFWFFVSVLLAWAVFARTICDHNKLFSCLDVLVYVSGILSVLAIIEVFTGFNPFLALNNSGADVVDVHRLGLTRAKSFTYQAITFGNYLTLTSSICVYRIVNCSTGRKKSAFKVIYVLMWLAVLSTISRSSILFFVTCQILLGLCMGQRKIFSKVFFVILIVAISFFVYINLVDDYKSPIMNLIYLMMSVFDDSYSANLSGVFIAEGNRLDLYSWVWDSIQGSRLFGMGPGAVFSHNITYGNSIYSSVYTKTSIEVEYLNWLFHYGIVGLITKVVFLFFILITCLKNGISGRKKGNFLNFEMALGCAFLAYFVSFFAVMQDTESRIFYILVFLLLAYRRNNIDYELEKIEEVSK